MSTYSCCIVSASRSDKLAGAQHPVLGKIVAPDGTKALVVLQENGPPYRIPPPTHTHARNPIFIQCVAQIDDEYARVCVCVCVYAFGPKF